MQLKTKIAIAGLAGLAVISGASLYFHRKRKTNLKDLNYINTELRKSLFGSKVAGFTQIQYLFTASNNLQLGSYLQELNLAGTDISGIQTRLCKKSLVERYFYECLDCVTYPQDDPQAKEMRESLESHSHQICEDCFDQDIHKGHKYKLLPGFQGRCDCGNASLFKESSFCSSHCGFKNLKKEYDEQLPSEKKLLTKKYFKDLFFLLIDGQSDLIHSKMKQTNECNFEKIKTEQLFVSYNILLTLIIDSINELLDLNHQLIYAFISLLQEPFEQPVRYRVDKQEICILEEREVNNKMTILDYLLVLQTSLNEKSMEKLNQLLILMTSADSQFLQFTGVQLMKQIAFSIKETIHPSEDESISYSEYSHSALIDLISNSLNVQSAIDKFTIENQADIILALEFMKETLNKITFVFDSDLLVFPKLFQFFTLLIHSLTNLQEVNILEEVIEILLDIQYTSFQRTIIDRNRMQEAIQALFQNISILMGICVTQSMIFEVLAKITSYCLQGECKDKKQAVLKILCKQYQQQIEEIHLRNLTQKHQTKRDLVYHGLSIASQLTNIVVISEGTDLSSENVINAIKNNFQFSHDNEVYAFVNKIADILHMNALTYVGDNYNAYLLLGFSQIMADDPTNQGVKEDFFNILLSSYSNIYDSNTLAFQLISTAQRQQDTIFYKYVTDNSKLKQPPNQSNYLENKQKWVINHSLIFDQTPFININTGLLNLLSSGKKDIEEKISYTVQQVISQSNNWKPLSCQRLSSLLEQVQITIQDKSLILNATKQLGDFNEQKETVNIKSLKDTDISYVHLGRYLMDITNDDLKMNNSPLFNTKFSINIFKNLYKYQKEFLINALFNTDLLNFITTTNADEIQTFKQWGIVFYYWVELIKLLENQPELLELKEQQIILDFKNQLLTRENHAQMKPIFEKISQLANNTGNYVRPECFDLKELYEEHEKQNKF